ncbi:MAG: hypothetical protein FH749_10050 [Firmicutes bacterium]|nr:hypothetical protein [Bacillota bacterium]
MLYGILLIIASIFLVLLSAWLRLCHRRKRLRLTSSLEPNETFLSREVRTVIANAGGIYVSLTLAAAFLKLEIAEQLMFWGLSFDPIAVLSLILALLQPIFLPDNS